MIVFPQNPAAQTPTNVFSPTSTPVTNTFNEAIYRWVAVDSQWVYDGPNENPNPPAPGASIDTPSITAPADGTTGVDPNSDVTITGSAYVSNNAGNHRSSSWQVVSGELPLVSTNRVSSVVTQDSDWAVQVNKPPVAGRPNTLLAGVWRFPNDRLMTCFSDKGINAADGEKYYLFISDDNGATWTEDTDRAIAGSGGDGNYFISTSSTPGTLNPTAAAQFTTGPGVGDIFFELESHRATFSRGWLYYDWSEDTYTGIASTASPANSFDHCKGELANGILIVGQGPGPNQRSLQVDPENLPNTELASSTSLAPQDLGFFATNGTVAWGWVGNDNVSGSKQNNPVKWFVTTNPNDLTDSGAITHWNSNISGTVTKSSVYWVPQIQRFVCTCAGGVLILYDPTLGATEEALSFMNVGTVEDIGKYWFDGTNHILVTVNSSQTIYSNDFENWTVVDGPAAWNISADGSRYVSITRQDGVITDPENMQIQTATNFDTATVLTIAGAETDGFEVGMNVENRGGVAATGSITDIDDTTVRLLPTTGTWVGDNTQRIAVPASEFSIVLDDREDTTNLTSVTLDSTTVQPNSDYRVRVGYKSDSNVTSSVSAWSTFTTS